MTLLYFVFGHAIENHQQAAFAILSWLRYEQSFDRIVVLTDAPEFYQFITDDRLVIQTTDAQQLREWEGPHRFFWRVKIKALAAIAERYPDSHLFYQDADTFCLNDPMRLRQQLDAGHNLMHAREGALAELPTRTERKMWQQCQGKPFAGLTINAQHQMWNAGVVAIARQQTTQVLPLALDICDEMCAAGVTRRLIEQFALSVALGQDSPVQPANGTIGHYWGNKAEWNEQIRTFFIRHHLRKSSLSEQITALRSFDFHQIPVYRRSSRTRQKLNGLVDKLFTKHQVTFAARQPDGSDRSERVLAQPES